MDEIKNPKIYHQELFEEYQNLRIKTKMSSGDLGDSGKYQVNYINAADVLERNKLREELINNLDFLSDEQLRELYQDDDIDMVAKAIRIIVQRKLKGK